MAEIEPQLTGAPYPGAPVTYAEAQAAGVELRRPGWGMVDVLIALVLSFLAPAFIVGGMVALGLPTNGAAVLLASFTTSWIGFGLWPWVTARIQGNGIRIDFGYVLRRTDLLWGLGGAVVMLVVGQVVARLTIAIFGDFNSAAGDAIAHADVPGVVYALLLLCAVIGAPLFEELCFRGLAFAAIAKWAAHNRLPAVPWATVLSAALFAGVHLEPVRFPLLFAIGLVLSWLRARTGRVGASVVAHALNNLLAFFV